MRFFCDFMIFVCDFFVSFRRIIWEDVKKISDLPLVKNGVLLTTCPDLGTSCNRYRGKL